MRKKAIGSTALHAGLPVSILALACVSAAGSAVAQSRYDGSTALRAGLPASILARTDDHTPAAGRIVQVRHGPHCLASG